MSAQPVDIAAARALLKMAEVSDRYWLYAVTDSYLAALDEIQQLRATVQRVRDEASLIYCHDIEGAFDAGAARAARALGSLCGDPGGAA